MNNDFFFFFFITVFEQKHENNHDLCLDWMWGVTVVSMGVFLGGGLRLDHGWPC